MYAEPDTAELNYHASTACRTLSHSLITLHTGVQYVNPECADIFSAVLLLITCLDHQLDLARVNADFEVASQCLNSFIALDDTNINKSIIQDISIISSAKFAECKTFNLKLYCFCLTTWIDGSTSLAIYEQLQKEYKAYECSKCKNWYHKACLLKFDIQLPTRKADFVCSRCTIPNTLSWSHREFTNTCTSDNFLTTFLLHSQQHPKFLSKHVGNTEIENALKACITLMKKGSINEGKSLILKMAHTKLNYGRTGNKKLDCYGNEYSAFLCLFSHIWKMQVKQQCTSPHCPSNNIVTERYQTTFSLPSSLSGNFKDINTIFPLPGDIIGYCSSEFNKSPPKEAPHAVTDRIDVISKKRSQFFECRGNFRVTSASFISEAPWLIPISIEEFNLTQINDLPLCISVYGSVYQLGGCSLNTGEHFEAIIMWHGRPYLYDGLKPTKSLRFVKYQPEKTMRSFNNNNYKGSYAYYFISDD